MKAMTRRAVVLIVWLLLAASASAQDVSWCVSVWYPSSEEPSGADTLRQHSDLIDIVNAFWYTPAADGTLLAVDGAENAAALAQWRAAGLKVIPSIFASLPAIIGDDLRDFHISQIVALVERMDYDGIDIDYEGFPASTRDDFSAFMEALAEALHANGRLLSVAVHAKTNDLGAWEGTAAQDWGRIAAAADIFAIMTYDYTNRNEPPGMIAPVDWMDAVLAYAATVTDLQKVRLGLPFYGYRWLRDAPPATTTSWAATQRLIQAYQPEVMRDEGSQEARIDFKARGLPKQTIVFNDAQTLAHRLAVLLPRYPALGGVAIWGIGGEDPANWDALRAIEGGRRCEQRPAGG
jgi:spore germination protein YaaH